MIDDHHGRAAGRATLLVRAVDGILGTHKLWSAVDARLRADCDLPLSRFAPMQVIARHGNCRVHDIAGELSMTVGGTSKLVDRIETSGYCIRSPNPGDRRSSIIELTPAGNEALARASAVFEDELRSQLGTAMVTALEISRSRPFTTGVDPRGKHREDPDDTDPEGTV